ncbi:MAG: hydroxymethylbilane synthase [Acidobacteriaceae bacterium]
MIIRIGSRGSQLALWQATHIADQLRAGGHQVEIQVIRTTGDRMQQPGFDPPADFDGVSLDSKGIFIKEIEDALAQGQIDLAVHSLKDLPTALDPRFLLAAIPRRADPRDVWVCEPFWGLHTLPLHGRIGTTSPRRQAQLLALRPDVEFVEIRGNIDTRLRRLEEGRCDALVLAAAGLDRLGRTEHVHYRFAPDELCPAPGQGALALETRSPEHPLDSEDPDRDPAIRQALAALNDAPSAYAVIAERSTLDALGGGCMLPIGVLCQISGDTARMLAQVVSPDGEAMIVGEMDGALLTPPDVLGQRLATTLIQRGALELLPDTVL